MGDKLKKFWFLFFGTIFVAYFFIFVFLLPRFNAGDDPFFAIGLMFGGFLVPPILLILGICYLYYFFSNHHNIEKIKKSLIPAVIALVFSLHFIFYLLLLYTFKIIPIASQSPAVVSFIETIYGICALLSFFGLHLVAIIAGVLALLDFKQGFTVMRTVTADQKRAIGNSEFYKNAIKKRGMHLLISFIIYIVLALIGENFKEDASTVYIYNYIIYIAMPIACWLLISFVFLIIAAVKYLWYKKR